MGERFYVDLDDETPEEMIVKVHCLLEEALGTDVLRKDERLYFYTYMVDLARKWASLLDDVEWPEGVKFIITYPDGSTCSNY